MKKTQLKRNNTALKKGSLRLGSGLKKSGKIKSKPKTEEEKKAQQEQFERDKAFYLEIWESMELPRRCFETGKFLPQEPLLTMFHHCLYKSKYPEYRYEKWNIVVILPDVHSLTHSDIDKTPKIKEYTIKLKQEYVRKNSNNSLRGI